MTPDELRAAMRAAQPSQRGQYVEHGRHQLIVDKALFKRTLLGSTAKESWIIEFKVEQSSNPTHEVGSTRSYIENPANQGWLERFMSCLMAIYGLDPSAPITPEWREFLGNVMAALQYDDERKRLNMPENFMAGRRVLVEGTPGTSKKGGPVTNKKWSPYVAPAAP